MTDLAREAIHATAAEVETALNSIQSSSQFKGLVSDKSKLATEGKAYIKAAEQAFQRAPGKLILDYSKLEASKLQLAYTPFGILRLDDDKTLFRLVPISGSIENVTFSEDGPRPVLQDRRLGALHFQLTMPPDAKTLIDQIQASGLDYAEFQLKELRLPGVTLKDVKGRMSLHGTQIVIELAQQDRAEAATQ